jgi:hypothetical protein
MSSKKDLVSHQVNPLYPKWDNASKKFTNHYKQEELLNVLDLIHQPQMQMEERSGSDDVRVPALKLARVITKMHTPPGPVMTWMHRVLRIYYHPPLAEGLRGNKLSARFALSDVANRLHDSRYSNIVAQACKGEITNAEFRRQIKLIRG